MTMLFLSPKRPFGMLLVATAVLAFLMYPRPASSADCEAAVVMSADLKPYREVLAGLRETMQCTVREVRLRDGDVIDRIRRMSPGAVVAIGTDAFRHVRSLRDVPLIHVMVIPAEVERDRAANLSGVSMDIAPATWLATIKRVFPRARRVGVLYDEENTGTFVEEARRAAPEAGLELVAKSVRGPEDVPKELEALRAVDVLWMLPDETVASPPMAEHLIRYSIAHRIPIMTFSRKYLDMGAVASLDVDPRDMGRQAGELANSILAGAGSGGSRRARKPLLSINARAADKMGVALDRAAMREAAVDD
jgi:putative ABC transport system substrate-binding protein